MSINSFDDDDFNDILGSDIDEFKKKTEKKEDNTVNITFFLFIYISDFILNIMIFINYFLINK